MSPLITVIMAVYNAEPFLSKAIESILQQSFRDFEFLIIDDKSTDNSLSIIENYKKIDERIKVINNDSNIGLALSLNKGIEIANGKYIARMDADDSSLPNRFSKQVQFMETHPDIWVLGGNFVAIDENDRAIKKSNYSNNPDIIRWNMMLGAFGVVSHPSVMIRRKMFSVVGKYKNLPTSQDLELWTRLFFEPKLPITNLDDVILEYRYHSNRISVNKKQLQCSCSNQVRHDVIQKLMQKKIPLELCEFYRGTYSMRFSKSEQRFFIQLWVDLYKEFISKFGVDEETQLEIKKLMVLQIGSRMSFNPLSVYWQGKLSLWHEVLKNSFLGPLDIPRVFLHRVCDYQKRRLRKLKRYIRSLGH